MRDAIRGFVRAGSERARADALQKAIDAMLAERFRPRVHAALDPAGRPAIRIRSIGGVYDQEQVRESMLLTLPSPGDLDVPGSPLRLFACVHAEGRR